MDPKITKFGFFLATLALGVITAVPSHPQVSGATLSGSITDAQGGAVPNAKVSALHTATGLSSETNTNAAGAYTIPNLIPGDYQVTVSASGFSTAVAKVTLTVGAKQELSVPLAVGQISTQVEVASVAEQVELSTSTVAGNVDAATVRELPLNGRDWASLATLEPSVVEARTHLDVTHVGGGGGRGFGDQLSVDGARPTQNSYRLDGAIVNDYSNAGPGSVLGKNLGVDAIQEFTVLTSNYSAEYGFTSGGVINAITKSGTNGFHGTGFDFLRNDKLDAANFFTNANGLQKNALRQNQFGGSGGWRIFKDRTFLFGAYEGVRKSAGLPGRQLRGVGLYHHFRRGSRRQRHQFGHRRNRAYQYRSHDSEVFASVPPSHTGCRMRSGDSQRPAEGAVQPQRRAGSVLGRAARGRRLCDFPG